MENTDGYTREGVQQLRAGRFDISKFINSNGQNGQNKNFRTFGNSYSGQLKLEGGELKAKKHRRGG